jgi:hypothetical protein
MGRAGSKLKSKRLAAFCQKKRSEASQPRCWEIEGLEDTDRLTEIRKEQNGGAEGKRRSARSFAPAGWESGIDSGRFLLVSNRSVVCTRFTR